MGEVHVRQLRPVIDGFIFNDQQWHCLTTLPDGISLACERLEAAKRERRYVTPTAIIQEIKEIISGDNGIYYTMTARNSDALQKFCLHIAHTIIAEYLDHVDFGGKNHSTKAADLLNRILKLRSDKAFKKVLTAGHQDILEIDCYLKFQALCLYSALSFIKYDLNADEETIKDLHDIQISELESVLKIFHSSKPPEITPERNTDEFRLQAFELSSKTPSLLFNNKLSSQKSSTRLLNFDAEEQQELKKTKLAVADGKDEHEIRAEDKKQTLRRNNARKNKFF